MATNIAPIQGLIELQDNFTSQLGIAQAALSAFSKENQESLKAIAGAAGLVAAAFTAVGAATLEMGSHGSDVADVDATLEHFAGSATAANGAMKALRDGTKGTVDNFALAKDAAHLLSAGVKLTAADMGTLGSAAFVLQNRGLGPTKDMLNLVSDALVTGRTKALAMAVGVVDTGDAEERYAAKLGTTKDMLSITGQAEAKRLAVMEILNKAVKDAGNQERDFGEQLEAARAHAVNFYDDLSKAVAASPVFAAGMKAVGTAFTQAFGDNNTDLVKNVVHWIEQAVIMGVNFGLAAIELARVVNVAWSAIKVVVLGTETILLGVATTVLGTIEMVTTALAAVPGAPKWIKDTAVAAHEASEFMLEMTKSVAAETVEASKGLVGHSEFDKTLDKLGGTILNVKDAMVAASVETGKNAETTDIAAANAKKLAAASAQASASMLDQAKVTAALTKSSSELSVIWDDYFAKVAKNSGTSGTAQRAEIEATFNKQVAALDALDPLFNAKYKAYRAVADESLKAIKSDWDSVKDTSIEGLQEQADKAYATYDKMLTSSLHFHREDLDAARDKYQKLQQEANGWSTTVVKVTNAASAAMKSLGDAGIKAGDAIMDSMGNVTKAVLLASGKIVALSDILKGFVTGFFDENGNEVNKTTQDRYTPSQFLQAASSVGNGVTADQLKQMVVAGYGSLEDIVRIASDAFREAFSLQVMHQKSTPGDAISRWKAMGGQVQGFGQGGVVDVMTGEFGPEVVRVPLGSTFYPTGTGPSGGGSPINLTFHVNGTAADVARKIKIEIMNTLKTRKQFGAA